MSRLVRMFLVLIAVNAVIGSVVLLAGGMDGTGGKVFLTSVLVTVAVVLGVTCATGWREPKRRPVAVVGIVSTALAFALIEATIWWSIDSDRIGKLIGTAMILAVASAGTCLLGLATLAPRHRWTFILAEVLAAVVVTMVILAIWTDLGTDWYLRVLGVLCVALASLAIAIPVLHRVYRSEGGRVGVADATLAFCPRCGSSVPAAAGVEARCPACGARYVVRILDGGPEPSSADSRPESPVARMEA